MEEDVVAAFALVRESFEIDRSAMRNRRVREISASDADLECGPG